MATVHTVTAYPVANGDTTQIVLANGRRVLLDFCHRGKGESTDTPEMDVKAQLKKELKEAKRDYFDVVAFTHADLDHIQGSTDFFELEHADKYCGNERIKMRQLWVPAAMLLDRPTRDEMSDEFAILRREAWHRLVHGKGIRVFSQPQELMDLLEPKLKERGESSTSRDHLFVDAGTVVDGFTLAQDQMEFFTHSPFVEHCEGGDFIRNEASLVFNIRFDVAGFRYDYLHFGDSEWTAIEDIVRITRYHNRNDRLAWDLFNIPHHCSYKCLSDEKGTHETTPKPLVKHLLQQGKRGAYIISSSKPIPNTEEKQPPHFQARNAYQSHLDAVSGRKLLVTMEQPNATKPEPLIFEITSGGVSWKRASAIGAAAIITSTPPRAG